jgi:D-galactarolactone cycloisomerase
MRNGLKSYRTCYLIRITTASGLSGWGECADWLPALDAGFKKRIIPYLIGKEAGNRTELVTVIKKWHQRAAAAVSMALTDITAKKAGLSVCELWGGKLREQIPVYASFAIIFRQARLEPPFPPARRKGRAVRI